MVPEGQPGAGCLLRLLHATSPRLAFPISSSSRPDLPFSVFSRRPDFPFGSMPNLAATRSKQEGRRRVSVGVRGPLSRRGWAVPKKIKAQDDVAHSENPIFYFLYLFFTILRKYIANSKNCKSNLRPVAESCSSRRLKMR
jgi:hypothetical protein